MDQYPIVLDGMLKIAWNFRVALAAAFILGSASHVATIVDRSRQRRAIFSARGDR